MDAVQVGLVPVGLGRLAVGVGLLTVLERASQITGGLTLASCVVALSSSVVSFLGASVTDPRLPVTLDGSRCSGEALVPIIVLRPA